jgi:hypothetical protein
MGRDLKHQMRLFLNHALLVRCATWSFSKFIRGCFPHYFCSNRANNLLSNHDFLVIYVFVYVVHL